MEEETTRKINYLKNFWKESKEEFIQKTWGFPYRYISVVKNNNLVLFNRIPSDTDYNELIEINDPKAYDILINFGLATEKGRNGYQAQLERNKKASGRIRW